jgi:hypothetical protein
MSQEKPRIWLLASQNLSKRWKKVEKGGKRWKKVEKGGKRWKKEGLAPPFPKVE